MSYSQIDTDNKNHILSLLKFLVDEVLSAGGDGDAIWHSKFYDIKDIHLLITANPSSIPKGWVIRFSDKALFLGQDQEGLAITNEQDHFDKRPSWTQCAIQW